MPIRVTRVKRSVACCPRMCANTSLRRTETHASSWEKSVPTRRDGPGLARTVPFALTMRVYGLLDLLLDRFLVVRVLVIGDLGAHGVHVEAVDLLDEVGEDRLRKGAGL